MRITIQWLSINFLLCVFLCLAVVGCSQMTKEQYDALRAQEEEREARAATVAEWVDRFYTEADAADDVVLAWLQTHDAVTEEHGYVEYFPFNAHCAYAFTYFRMDDFFGNQERPDMLADFLASEAAVVKLGICLPAPGCENKRAMWFLNTDGEWAFGGMSGGRDSVARGGPDGNLYRGRIVHDLSAFDFGEIVDMKLLDASDTIGGISFVYVYNGEVEYLVPYGGWSEKDNPFAPRLTEGKVYTLDEMIRVLDDWYT
ncbi:MAG: hypothetical protein IJW97_00490 [Clostridia bacterium]|nr:hypothetical protein [Clostridia bacterium]